MSPEYKIYGHQTPLDYFNLFFTHLFIHSAIFTEYLPPMLITEDILFHCQCKKNYLLHEKKKDELFEIIYLF